MQSKTKQRTYRDALREQREKQERAERANELRAEFKLIEGGGAPKPSTVKVTVHPGAELTLGEHLERDRIEKIKRRREYLASQGFGDFAE